MIIFLEKKQFRMNAHLKHYNPEGEIVNWLKAPLMDWNLGLKLVEEIQKKL
jgi:hypothetical protein